MNKHFSKTYKILVIGPAWVGDAVMAQSLFKTLKQQFNDVRIDVLAPAWTFSVFDRMPEIAHTHLMPFGHGEFKWRERYALAKSLRKYSYDRAILLPNSFKSALIPWWAGIPKRTGWLGECRYGLLNDIRYLNKKRYPLMIEQFMALGLPKNASLLKPYPYPAFAISKTAQDIVLIKHQPIWRDRPVVALCPGAEFGPSKRWPEVHYAAVANHLLDAGIDVWLFGSKKDRPVTDTIMQLTHGRCENISGRTELEETMDLLSLVSGVVTNDSGLMHIACAFKKPVIALYGSTSPDFTPPLSNAAKVIKLNLACQPCFARSCPLQHHRCMRELLPEQVISHIHAWGIM